MSTIIMGQFIDGPAFIGQLVGSSSPVDFKNGAIIACSPAQWFSIKSPMILDLRKTENGQMGLAMMPLGFPLFQEDPQAGTVLTINRAQLMWDPVEGRDDLQAEWTRVTSSIQVAPAGALRNPNGLGLVPGR